MTLSASASEARFDEMMALNYQTMAQKVAVLANVTALFGSETPSAAQLRGFLDEKVSRLWHRSLTSAEMGQLTSLYAGGAATDGASHAFGMVLEAVLQAPSFLFHG